MWRALSSRAWSPVLFYSGRPKLYKNSCFPVGAVPRHLFAGYDVFDHVVLLFVWQGKDLIKL
jgi:hypothetical protein